MSARVIDLQVDVGECEEILAGGQMILNRCGILRAFDKLGFEGRKPLRIGGRRWEELWGLLDEVYELIRSTFGAPSQRGPAATMAVKPPLPGEPATSA